MNRLLNISYGLMMMIAIASCAVANKEDMANIENLEKIDDSYEVDAQFTAEKLERGNLIAFESRAKEKLADFFNYLTIISDPEYDDAFKSHAMVLASDLFTNNQILFPLAGEGAILSIEEILDNHLKGTYGKRQYDVISVTISKKLENSENDGYIGALSFHVSMKQKDEPGSTSEGQIDMHAMKVDKHFGQTKRSVWEVFLGQ